MGYTSDFRVKLLMRDVQLEVTKKLQKEGYENPLKLRIFDESNDDQILWSKGGLTFRKSKKKNTTKKNMQKGGSNDGAWYIDKPWTDPFTKEKSPKTPLLVVEGSFGTETGNVGSAQKARFNHALTMAERGIIGAYLMPKFSEYYSSPPASNKTSNPPIFKKPAKWVEDLVLSCIGITEEYSKKKKSGLYLMIDAYNKEHLFDLVYSLAKKQLKISDAEILLNKTTTSILCEMKEHVKNYDLLKSFASMRSQTVTSIPWKDGSVNPDWIGKIMKGDQRAFTTTDHRNGHIYWGEVEILHSLTKKNVFLILPRFVTSDKKLISGKKNKTKKKEWNALNNSPYVDIITLDDIIFRDQSTKHIKSDYKRLIGANFGDGSPEEKEMNKLWKELKQGLLNGKIRINR
jgi:hypothetical protein